VVEVLVDGDPVDGVDAWVSAGTTALRTPITTLIATNAPYRRAVTTDICDSEVPSPEDLTDTNVGVRLRALAPPFG
jgi:hypothetical protein